MQLGNAIIFLVIYKEKCDFGVRNTQRLGCSLIEHSGLLSTNLHLWLIIDKPPCPVKITNRAVQNILLASWYDACFWDTMILTYQEWLSKLFKLKKQSLSAKISFALWISQTNGKIGASSLTGTLVPIATMTRPMTNSSTPIIHPVLATMVTISKLRANVQSIDNAMQQGTTF